MTLTSHGHHIPGTVDTDEASIEVRTMVRCGGPKLCQVCKTDACRVLPDDSIAKASLLDDLDALVVKEEPLMVTKFEKHGPEAEVMFFTGKNEEAPNIIRWLRSHGIPATYQEPLNETLHSDVIDSEPRKIEVPPMIVITNGHDGRNTIFISAAPDTAIVHWDGDRNYVDVMPVKHFQGNFRVRQVIDPAADLVQVEVK